MNKKLLFIILTVIMIFSITACEKKTKVDVTETTTNSTYKTNESHENHEVTWGTCQTTEYVQLYNLDGYEDALLDVVSNVLFEKYPYNYEFNIATWEELKINNYEMCKYDGIIQYQTDSESEPQEQIATIYIIKNKNTYNYFLIIGEEEKITDNTKTIQYFTEEIINNLEQ